MIIVSDNFLVKSVFFFFFLHNKVSPFLAQAQGICVYVGHSCLLDTYGPTPLIGPSA